MIKLVVGLGNPGKEYERTRHNIGFMVIDELVKYWRIKTYSVECLSHLYVKNLGDRRILLAKPQTYMNNSGLAVVNLLEEYGIHPSEMLVVHDELDLPLGRLKLKFGGSSAGHHGIESIVKEIKTEGFYRLRVGIGRPQNKNKVVQYVLSPFSKEEEPLLYRVLERARECIIRSIEMSPEECMNFCNAPLT